MKKIFFLSFVLIFLFVSCDQNKDVTKTFSKYKLKEGVTSITIPGWVLNLAVRWGDLEKEERDLLQSISKIKILTIDDNNLNSRSNLHREFYQSVSAIPGMEELLVVKNDTEQVTVFGKTDEGTIYELFVLVGGDDNAMIYLKGKLQTELLASVVNKSNQHRLFAW